MSESPLWALPLPSMASSGLIHAYDHSVADESLRMELADPPFAAWLVRRGSVNVKFRGATKTEREIVAHKNQWLLLPAIPRIHQMSRGTHLLSVRMTLGRSHGRSLLLAKRAFCLEESRVPHLASLASRVVHLLPSLQSANMNSQDGLLAELALKAAFLSWIEAYLRLVLGLGWRLTEEKPRNAPVQKVLGLMQQQGFSFPLRQLDLARTSGLSLSHLKRTFCHDLGVSPFAWWQNQRFKEACRLLRGTDLPLKAIGGVLAFRFPSHFSIWFRKRAGMSPIAFRRKVTVDV